MSCDRWPIDSARTGASEIAIGGGKCTLGEIMDKILSLRENNNVSSVLFYIEPDRTFEESREVIDTLADLLESNRNIKTLKLDFSWTVNLIEARAFLLETLANGNADNLDSLWICPSPERRDTAHEAQFLDSFLSWNRNLTRLDIELHWPHPETLQLMSSLANSSVTQLCLAFWPIQWRNGTLGDLATKLAQCNSVFSLRLHLNRSQHHWEVDLQQFQPFFEIGIANMRSLTRFEFSF